MKEEEITRYAQIIKDTPELFLNYNLLYAPCEASIVKLKATSPEALNLFASIYKDVIGYRNQNNYFKDANGNWISGADCNNALTDIANQLSPLATKEDFCKIGNSIKVKYHKLHFSKMFIKMLKAARPTKPRKRGGIDWKSQKYAFNYMELALLKSSLKGKVIPATAIVTMLDQIYTTKDTSIVIDYLDVMIEHVKEVTITLVRAVSNYPTTFKDSKYAVLNLYDMRIPGAPYPVEVSNTYSSDIPIIQCLLIGTTDTRYIIRLQYVITHLNCIKDPRAKLLINNSSKIQIHKIKDKIQIQSEINTKLLEVLDE